MSATAKVRIYLGLCIVALVIVATSIFVRHGDWFSKIASQVDAHRVVQGSLKKKNSVEKAQRKDRSTKNISEEMAEMGSPKAGPSTAEMASNIRSESLKSLLGIGGNATLPARMAAISKLSKESLSEQDREWLFAFLSSRESIDGITKIGQHALKDGIMNMLSKNSTLVPETAEVLSKIFEDERQDVVIRNYALQYLGYIEPKLDEGQKNSVLEVLKKAASQQETDSAGIAVLSLFRLRSQPASNISNEEIAEIALVNATSRNVPDVRRIQALQVCGQMNVQEAAPIARDLVKNGSSAMVKMAAIATLSQIGNRSDIQILSQECNNSDRRVNRAAEIALQNINTRLK